MEEDKMKGFCPACEKESELTRVRRVEDLHVKGEIIPVEIDYFVCAECGAEFDNPAPDYDPLAAAYQEYRRRKGMLQPQEIAAFREKYHLTQRELSMLLGFGGATLSRYENGALQDEAHDNLMRLIMAPENLLAEVNRKSQALSAEKLHALIHQLNDEIGGVELTTYLRRRSGYNAKNIYNGLKDIDINRLLNAVKLLCYQTTVYKTKLNKLLFYADFKHFKQHGASITGLCYAHIPYGPVPDQFEFIFEKLIEIDPALVREEDAALDCSAEYFRCEAEPDKSVFSLTELEVLIQVKDFFRAFSAREIKDYSHEEEGYKQTRNSELISYAFAAQLRL
jgi:putative zinc finger/helix-turn-helix YgiT family protein